ncbi:hypothetical protein O3P69_015397 [Scylla paramamosain]|uniref:Major facilitator superfamily (MFS) profile domain-containing protein n=1 Tax=Scylla paramamosain TaxID=85552 RepID=A0AAW0T7U9_SCYPA
MSPVAAVQGGLESGQATHEDVVNHVRPPEEDPPLRGISSYSSSLPSSSSSSSASSSSADLTRGYGPPLSHSTPSVGESQGVDTSDYPVYRPTTEAKEKLLGTPKSRCRREINDTPEPRRKKRVSVSVDEEQLWMFTKRQWFLLLVVCSSTFTSSFAICLFPPFFPKLAQQKGCSSTIFGLIIGMNCLTTFLVTPYIGKKLRTIGIKFAFTSGVFASGVCCVLSGLLEWFPPGVPFILVAILVRVAHATANALSSTANFAYIGLEFPNEMAKVFAWTRTCMNVAQMFGPVVSGELIEEGGFKLPFFVMGSLQVCMTMLCCLLPPDEPLGAEQPQDSREVTIRQVVSIPGIWIAFITFIFSTMSNGFLSINLEPQVLRQFGLREGYVGLLFGLKDGINSLASPFWGWSCDRRRNYTKHFIFISSILAFTSFFLLGPFPGLPFERTVGTVILSLSLNGVGIGGQQVAGVVDAMRESVGAGLPDQAGLHGCVAGLWASLSGIGRFTSRTGSGYLVDTIGFRKTSAIVVALHVFVMVMTGTYLLVCGKREMKRREQSKEPLGGIGVLTASPSDPVTTKTVSWEGKRREEKGKERKVKERMVVDFNGKHPCFLPRRHSGFHRVRLCTHPHPNQVCSCPLWYSSLQ